MENKIRVILQSSEYGENEYVTFTENFDDSVEDYLYPDCKLDSDTVIENNLPSGFPTGYTLKRQ